MNILEMEACLRTIERKQQKMLALVPNKFYTNLANFEKDFYDNLDKIKHKIEADMLKLVLNTYNN